MHRDIVTTIPEGYFNLGSSPKCAIQGLYLPGKSLTIQAHPEFNGDLLKLVVNARAGQGIFGPELAREALSRISLDYDESCSAQAICKFLLE